MHVQFENCLTDRHLLLFGRIVQSFARHEALMEEIMATVSGADPTSVKLMTSHLPFGWKRATMLGLLRHRGVPLDRVDDVQSFFDPLHTMSHLRDDIAHSAWSQAEPNTTIWPSWLSASPRTAVKAVHDIGPGKTYFEDFPERFTYTLEQLAEIADGLDQNETALRQYLAANDLAPL